MPQLQRSTCLLILGRAHLFPSLTAPAKEDGSDQLQVKNGPEAVRSQLLTKSNAQERKWRRTRSPSRSGSPAGERHQGAKPRAGTRSATSSEASGSHASSSDEEEHNSEVEQEDEEERLR